MFSVLQLLLLIKCESESDNCRLIFDVVCIRMGLMKSMGSALNLIAA